MLVRTIVSLTAVISLALTLLAGCSNPAPTATPAPAVPPKAAAAATAPPVQPTATPASVKPTAPTVPAAAPKAEVLDPAKVLPKTMYWSALEVGNSAYVQAGLMADAFMKKYGVKIRIIPAGSGLGRVSTIKNGQAVWTMLTEEVFYATNALYEYQDMGWGPQDLRVVLGHPAATGFPVRADSGIKTSADWKGKRIAYVTGLASFTEPIEAALAFAGLTPKDVIRVEFPSVGAAYSSLKEGKADVTKGTPTAPALYELESSPFGCAWTQFDPNNKEGWARLNKIMPWTTPRRETTGAGISASKPSDLWTFIYPQLTTATSTDETVVYALTKGMDETFDLYKGGMSGMDEWAVKIAGIPPVGAPFHRGAIRYFKEKGIWTQEYQDWNDRFEAGLKRIQDVWQVVLGEATEKGMKEQDYPAYWAKRRVELGAERLSVLLKGK